MTAGTVDVRARWQALIERILPWFDETRERERDQHTETVIDNAERVRNAYIAAAARTTAPRIRK